MLRNTLTSSIHLVKPIIIKNTQSSPTLAKKTSLTFSQPHSQSTTHPLHNTLTYSCRYSFFKSDVTIDYKKNYYEILKVGEKSTLMEIKKSFYKLAKQSHPDTSKGNEEVFKSINQAYNVLSHQERRKVYDTNRSRPQKYHTEPRAHQSQQTSTSSQQPHNNQSTSQQHYKQSQQYSQRQQQAYYHYNRGQWQQFRSGYKYHVSPQNQYYSNITNNTSYQKIFQNMKNKQDKKSKEEEEFLEDMERYFEYTEKINKKKKLDMEEYHRKMQEMEAKVYEERKELFKQTIVGKAYFKIEDTLMKISDALQRYLTKENGTKQK